MRFRGRPRSGQSSQWYQMPAPVSVLQQVLVPSRYQVHVHDPWEDTSNQSPRGLEKDCKDAILQHQSTFVKLCMDDTCPICLDKVELPATGCESVYAQKNRADELPTNDENPATITLPCGHCFHEGCCDEWFTRSRKCPTCRFEVVSVAAVLAAAARVEEIVELDASVTSGTGIIGHKNGMVKRSNQDDQSFEQKECNGLHENGLGWLVAEATKAAKEASLLDNTGNDNDANIDDDDEERTDEEDVEDDGHGDEIVERLIRSRRRRFVRSIFWGSSSSAETAIPERNFPPTVESSNLSTFSLRRRFASGSNFFRNYNRGQIGVMAPRGTRESLDSRGSSVRLNAFLGDEAQTDERELSQSPSSSPSFPEVPLRSSSSVGLGSMPFAPPVSAWRSSRRSRVGARFSTSADTSEGTERERNLSGSSNGEVRALLNGRLPNLGDSTANAASTRAGASSSVGSPIEIDRTSGVISALPPVSEHPEQQRQQHLTSSLSSARRFIFRQSSTTSTSTSASLSMPSSRTTSTGETSRSSRLRLSSIGGVFMRRRSTTVE